MQKINDQCIHTTPEAITTYTANKTPSPQELQNIPTICDITHKIKEDHSDFDRASGILQGVNIWPLLFENTSTVKSEFTLLKS